MRHTPVVGVAAWRYDPLSQQRIEYVVVTGEKYVRGVREKPEYGPILEDLNPIYAMYNGNDRFGSNILIYKIKYPLENQWWLDEVKVPNCLLRVF